MLSAGIGETLWLGPRAEYFGSESTFSRSESLFPPLGTWPRFRGRLWQKQRGDFHRYCQFCLKIPNELLPFRSQTQPRDLCPGYPLTLLVRCPAHPLRTRSSSQRKILLKASSQESLHWQRWGAVSSGGIGTSSPTLPFSPLSAVFLCSLSQRKRSHSSRRGEKEKHWQSERWKLQMFSGQSWRERWKKPGTSLGQVLKPHACRAGSEEYELILFGGVT